MNRLEATPGRTDKRRGLTLQVSEYLVKNDYGRGVLDMEDELDREPAKSILEGT